MQNTFQKFQIYRIERSVRRVRILSFFDRHFENSFQEFDWLGLDFVLLLEFNQIYLTLQFKTVLDLFVIIDHKICFLIICYTLINTIDWFYGIAAGLWIVEMRIVEIRIVEMLFLYPCIGLFCEMIV